MLFVCSEQVPMPVGDHVEIVEKRTCVSRGLSRPLPHSTNCNCVQYSLEVVPVHAWPEEPVDAWAPAVAPNVRWVNQLAAHAGDPHDAAGCTGLEHIKQLQGEVQGAEVVAGHRHLQSQQRATWTACLTVEAKAQWALGRHERLIGRPCIVP